MKYARMKMNKHSVVSLRRSPVLLFFCMALIAAALPESTQAQEWRIEPIVKFGVEYDDNATLRVRTDEEVGLEGLLLDLRADIYYASATTSFFLQPRALLRSYPDEPDFDSDDYFLRSLFRYRGQVNTIGYFASFEQQSIRTAERLFSDLEIDDPDEITDDDSGRVFISGTRDRWRVAPYWDYKLSEISSVGARFDYSNVQYEGVFAGILSDYTDMRLSLNYRRKISNVNTALFELTARTFSSAGDDTDTNGYGVLAGFVHNLSEKTTLQAMFGAEDARKSGFSSDPQAVGYIRLTRNLETIRMFVQYRRSISGSGAGNLAGRDSLSLNFRRRLNEKISAGLGVRAYTSSGIGGNISIDDRNYVQLQSSFRWYLSRSFVIEVDYRYTVNDRSATIGERANSNQVTLWFTYQPKTTPRL